MSNITIDRKTCSDDEDLKYVLLCQGGDTEAFAVLVERHQKKMLNIALRMVGNYEDACDVTQEAFVAAYKAIRKFKGEAKFSTWLYRIVINHSKNRLKKLRGFAASEDILSDDSGEGGKKYTGNHIQADDHPGLLLEKRERDEQVQKCITSLDDDYREVLVLRDIEGFSYEEIREMLKIPDGTVKSRLSRARNALKDCLAKIMGDL